MTPWEEYMYFKYNIIALNLLYMIASERAIILQLY